MTDPKRALEPLVIVAALVLSPVKFVRAVVRAARKTRDQMQASS